MFRKKVFWNIKQIHTKTVLPESFFRLQACNFFKKVLMNKRYSVNGSKHMRTTASDLGKYLATLTITFDSVENIWNFGQWSNLTTVFKHDIAGESCLTKVLQ